MYERGDRGHCVAWLLPAVLCCLAGCRSAPTAWPEPVELPSAEIVVDLTHVEERRVPLTMVVEGISGRNNYFVYNGPEGEYDLHQVRFEDGKGRTVSHVRTDDTFHLESFEGKTIKAFWVMEPGGLGRHGHQGMIGEDWATFDGRMFLMPAAAGDLRAARIRFEMPRDWSAATPFRERDGWYYLDTLGRSAVSIQLANACVGVGRFETRRRTMGNMEVRVSAYTGWSVELREQLFASSLRLMQRFHDELGFDLGAPYSVVWTPEVAGTGVHGGSHVNGTCLQNPDHRLRSFELLAHRAAHSMNKYPPTGMKMLGPESGWFKEGWPSFVESIAADVVGTENEPHCLARQYTSYLRALDDPERDVPLIDEPSTRGETQEFLHYVKGPLVAQMLDDLIARRTGNTLQYYMRQIWAEHSGFRAPYAIKETLEEMTGVSLDAFWQSAVHERGKIVPCWKDFVTDSMRALARDSSAGRVGDTWLSVDYLHHLAVGGEFQSFAEVGEFLVEEEARRRQLEARNLQMCPDSLLPHLAVIPAEARLAVVHLERAQLPQPEPDRSLQFTPESGPGVARIRRLFDQDERYRARVASGSVRAIEVTTSEAPDRPCLAFPTGGTVELRIDWRGKPRPATLILRTGREELHRRTLTKAEAGESILIPPLHRPLGEALVEFELIVEGQPPVTRVFWQRDPPWNSRLTEMSLEEQQDPGTWHSHALVFVTRGQFSHALTALEHTIALAPDKPRFRLTRARVFVQIERFHMAIASFDEVLKLNSDYAAAIGGRADALAAIGESAAALEAIESLMQSHDTFAARFSWQGRVFERLSRMEDAATSYARYTEAMPRKADGWKQLGRVLASLDRPDEAIEALERGLKLDPTDEELQQLRAAIRVASGGSSRRH